MQPGNALIAMRTEHERKFLLKNDSWKTGAEGLLCRQGYIAEGNQVVVRVRVMGNEGFLTIKERIPGISRGEYEYAIPHEDAEAMLDEISVGVVIEKLRYRVPYAGHLWEIDEFHGVNQGLVVAEIELSAADTPFARPEWLGAEVTGDARYYNAHLAYYPFSTW